MAVGGSRPRVTIALFPGFPLLMSHNSLVPGLSSADEYISLYVSSRENPRVESIKLSPSQSSLQQLAQTLQQENTSLKAQVSTTSDVQKQLSKQSLVYSEEAGGLHFYLLYLCCFRAAWH